MVSIQNPVIVIPGITASTLHDDYPMKTEDVWSMVFNKDYRRIAPHPDNLKYEALEPALIHAGRLFALYDDLINQLRYELSETADRPTPVFPFPYDWRRDIRETAKELRVFVEEVIDRTKLLRHYANYSGKINLVGHSMGGLIICEYLRQFGNDNRVDKIATLGTPFMGSIEAVVKITTGMSLLAGSRPSEREREAARVTPAVYQLLPSYKNAIVTKKKDGTIEKEVSLFQPDNWQYGILESLAEYIRLHSVTDYKTKKDQFKKAEGTLKNLLSAVEDHRNGVKSLKLDSLGLSDEKWLAIVGLGEKTRLQITINNIQNKKKLRFELSEDQFINEWEYTKEKHDMENTGDATVPFKGACPPFKGIDKNQLVCVSEKDLGFWELRDRASEDIIGLHGLLPRINLVQRLIVKHFYPSYKGKTWGMPAPGAYDDWKPPIANLVKKKLD